MTGLSAGGCEFESRRSRRNILRNRSFLRHLDGARRPWKATRGPGPAERGRRGSHRRHHAPSTRRRQVDLSFGLLEGLRCLIRWLRAAVVLLARLGGLRESVPHHARVERNAFTLVVRGSFISRLYSGDSTATSATLPSALLCKPHP
jgi:hypothetical protein